MKEVRCGRCGAVTKTHTWRRLGWSKVELFYADGNRWRQYTCAGCQKELPEPGFPGITCLLFSRDEWPFQFGPPQVHVDYANGIRLFWTWRILRPQAFTPSPQGDAGASLEAA